MPPHPPSKTKERVSDSYFRSRRASSPRCGDPIRGNDTRNSEVAVFCLCSLVIKTHARRASSVRVVYCLKNQLAIDISSQRCSYYRSSNYVSIPTQIVRAGFLVKGASEIS